MLKNCFAPNRMATYFCVFGVSRKLKNPFIEKSTVTVPLTYEESYFPRQYDNDTAE